MNDGVKKDRSPKGPVIPLKEAIEYVKKLSAQIGRSKVNVETASKVLGYSGVNGVTLTTIATLSQYQLIERDKGQLSVSPLAFRIMHPTSGEQAQKSLQEAALAPEVFGELFQNYRDASEDVISSHLVQNRFTLERAKRVAHTFKSNLEFLPQDATGLSPIHDEGESNEQSEVTPHVRPTAISLEGRSSAQITPRLIPAHVDPANVLARYSIPLGENEATLIFTGNRLAPEDFTALIEYVELFKKQFERRQAKETHQPKLENTESIPGN